MLTRAHATGDRSKDAIILKPIAVDDSGISMSVWWLSFERCIFTVFTMLLSLISFKMHLICLWYLMQLSYKLEFNTVSFLLLQVVVEFYGFLIDGKVKRYNTLLAKITDVKVIDL